MSAAIGTGPHDLHRMRKAAINPFFSTRSVAKMEDALQRYTLEFREDLSKRVGSVLDLRVYFLAWTADFITGQIFQRRLQLFWDGARAQQFFDTNFTFSGIFPLTKHLPWLVTMGLDAPLLTWKVLYPPLVQYIAIYKVRSPSFLPIYR